MSNKIDRMFNNMIDFLKNKSYEDIFNCIKHNFEYVSKKQPKIYTSITNFYNKHMLWGSIDIENNNYELIENNARSLYNDMDNIIWLYNHMEDNRSKKIIMTVIYYWFSLDYAKVEKIIDNNYSQYFDLDLINVTNEEVFLDIGGYIGDTIISYTLSYGKDMHKKIYTYEIIPKNIQCIEDNMKKFSINNVEIIKKGVSNKKGIMFVDNKISDIAKPQSKGEVPIELVTVDEDICEKISFIKMDIEGGEENAIIGCKNTIIKYHPKLAISIYHSNNHLWKIAKLIHEYDNSYKFYIRYYGGKLLPTEYILYAL